MMEIETHYGILHYLDKKRYLSKMKAVSQFFLENLTEKEMRKFPPLRFVMNMDVMDLFDLHPDLGCSLLNEPVMWQNICNEILFACLQSENDDLAVTEAVKPTQVAVNLRFENFPTLLVRPYLRCYSGLTMSYGLLVSVSKPSSYVYHTVWTCPEECEGNEVILQHIPKTPPKCEVCRSILFENCGLRRCGEQVTSTFKTENELIPKSYEIVDDLIPKLQLGSKYNIFTVTMKNKAVVWSLEEVIPLSAPVTSPVPTDIKKLYKACKGIPWQFIYCLASSIGVNVCPISCFMNLKINLLLSLTSVKASIQSGSNVIHVLAAGYDTGYAGRLMQEGAKLADSHVFLGTSNTESSAALIACSGGVCVMPIPLHSYNQKLTNSILSSIEAGDVTTETTKTKLQCVVWAQGMDFKKMNLINVASIFGTVCRGDYGEYNDEIVDFVLENGIEPAETTREEVEALKDVTLYIDLVAGMQVSLDHRAEMLLRNYFLTARKERPRGVTSVSMKALVATCQTSARLCQRKIASIDDAIFAIWLHISGSPEPRIAPDEYLQTPADIKRLEKIMGSFKDWLVEFTGTFIS